MANLFEGLKEGDLAELVLPMISIDEFESKLDDDSIVVAFYVGDRDPSQDLNRFIQKGAASVLDTDVSPAPNEDGYYMVFVEFLRDENFPAKLISTVESLEGLTGITAWKAQIYDVEGVVPVTLDCLIENVRLASHEDHAGHEDDVEESLTEFFRASDLDNMVIEGKTVTLEGLRASVVLQFVDLGTTTAVVENNAVMASATRLDEVALSNTRRIQNMLGEQWIAQQRGNYLVVGQQGDDTCALFRL